MLPVWEEALIRAKATVRLEGGLGIELLTQARKTIDPAWDWAIRKLTRYLLENGIITS